MQSKGLKKINANHNDEMQKLVKSFETCLNQLTLDNNKDISKLSSSNILDQINQEQSKMIKF